MPDEKPYQTAYDRHWARLAELLGPDEAAAERARMTADEKADRLRKRVIEYKTKQLPHFREALASAERDGRLDYARKLRTWIAYRERVIADYETNDHADV